MEKIYNLPVDKIPLSNEEKDVFQWLYPKKEVQEKVIETNNNELEKPNAIVHKNTRHYQYYVNLLCSFVLIFSAVYPKWNNVWKKMIPTEEDNVLFSLVKVFTIFFVLYFINYIFHKYK